MKIKQVGSNMTELHKNDGTVVLFSYETPVAAYGFFGYYKTSTKYSRTTSKHINTWTKGEDFDTVNQSKIDALVK